MTSGWQGAPYFQEIRPGAASKTGISLKKRWGGTVERLRVEANRTVSVPRLQLWVNASGIRTPRKNSRCDGFDLPSKFTPSGTQWSPQTRFARLTRELAC